MQSLTPSEKDKGCASLATAEGFQVNTNESSEVCEQPEHGCVAELLLW